MKEHIQNNMNGYFISSMILMMDPLWSNVAASAAVVDRCCVGK